MKTFLTVTLISCLSLAVWAQDPPGPFLESADIDRFISTYEPMMKEFEALEEQLEEVVSEGDSYEEILKEYQQTLKSDEAVEIIRKYGWQADTFGAKMMAISMGSTYLIAEKRLNDLPAEQRAMMASMMQQFDFQVHPDDLKVLEPHLDELEAFFNGQ